MRDINVTGGNVTINIFDGCTIETIRIDGGTHTHNYGQSPETLKVTYSQELVGMLTIIARMLKTDIPQLACRYVVEGIQKDVGEILRIASTSRPSM